MEDKKSSKRKADSHSDEEQSHSKKTREWIPPHLLDLSDDVLLFILGYIGTSDLLHVSDVCKRLLQIASDVSLWRKVNTISQPLPVSRFRKILKFMNNKINSVCIGGLDPPGVSVTPALLEAISVKCPMLEEFVLDGCHLDAER